MAKGAFDGIIEEADKARMLFHLELFDKPKDGEKKPAENQSNVVQLRPK